MPPIRWALFGLQAVVDRRIDSVDLEDQGYVFLISLGEPFDTATLVTAAYACVYPSSPYTLQDEL